MRALGLVKIPETRMNIVLLLAMAPGTRDRVRRCASPRNFMIGTRLQYMYMLLCCTFHVLIYGYG